MTPGCCAPPSGTQGGTPARHGRSAVPRASGNGARAAVGGAHDDGRPVRELPPAAFLMGTEVSDGFPRRRRGPGARGVVARLRD